jgi:hypothetical protein
MLTEYLCRAPNADHRRAATLLLACLDDDGADTVAIVLEEAHASSGTRSAAPAPTARAPT